MASTKTIVEKLGEENASIVLMYFLEGRSFLEISDLMPSVFPTRSAVSAFKRDYKTELLSNMAAYVVQYGPVKQVGRSKCTPPITPRPKKVVEERVKKVPELVVVSPPKSVKATATQVSKPIPVVDVPKPDMPSTFPQKRTPVYPAATLEAFKADSLSIAVKMESGTEGILLRDIEDGQCRTPVGEQGGEMLCCGNDTGSKRKSTCEVHQQKKYQAGTAYRPKNLPRV